MNTRRRRPRSAVAREFGYPWPWKVEGILLEEFERADGDARALANAFGCHPTTLEKWLSRYEIRDRAELD